MAFLASNSQQFPELMKKKATPKIFTNLRFYVRFITAKCRDFISLS